jgi:hypothetical protein
VHRGTNVALLGHERAGGPGSREEIVDGSGELSGPGGLGAGDNKPGLYVDPDQALDWLGRVDSADDDPRTASMWSVTRRCRA